MKTGTTLVKGMKWTGFGAVLKGLIQLAQHLILAWLLMPADFGIMSAILVVINIIAPIYELGLSSSIIQAREINDKQLSTLYWLGILSGISIYGISCLFAPLISLMFFREVDISQFLRIAFLYFIIQPVGMAHRAILNRMLRFDLINIIAVASSAFSFATAILLALLGFGAYSLIGGFLAATVIDSAVYWMKGRAFFKPGLDFDIYEVRKELRFGVFQSGAQLVNSISANLDKFIISNFLGASALGFYSWAWNIVMIPLRRINPVFVKVAFPLFSSLGSRQEEVSRVYIQSVTGLMILSTPVLIILAASSEIFVFTVFGAKWMPAAEVLSILSIVGLLKAFANPGGSVILSKGRADIEFYWNLFWSFWVAGFIILALLKLERTIEAVAWAQLAAGLVLGWVWHSLVHWYGEINYRALLRSVAPLFLMAATTFLIILFIGRIVFWEGWWLLTLKVILGTGVYCLVGYFFYKEFFRKTIRTIKS